MTINRNNVTEFITYLYKKRRGGAPPADLLQRWLSLPEDEIGVQLDGLFRHWGLTAVDRQKETDNFFRDTLYPPAPAPVAGPQVVSRPVPVAPAAYVPAPAPRRKKPRLLLWSVMAVLIVTAGYTGYKYLQFSALDYIYTITDNVAVRDDNKAMVARMDLFEVKNELPSYQKLKAFDKNIYYRSIDNSDKTYPCRKVLLKDGSFWAYLVNKKGIAGYVNTNYVVDNYNEFRLYQTAFKEVKNNKAENTALKAIYRKIIIGSMGLDPDMADKYIVTHTEGLPRPAVDRTYAVLKQTIVDNIKYVIIAGLSDGYYYRFEGDIKENRFVAPEKIAVINSNSDPVPLGGSYRFFNIGRSAYLYDCKANLPLNFEAIEDGNGKIYAFKYKPPVDTMAVPADTLSTTN